MPVIGFLHVAFPGPYAQQLAAFRQGLKQSGYVEGRNVAIEYRWANNENDRLPELAADLVRRQVALKVLPFAAALDGRQLQRFKMEAQAAAQLHHSNIVPVFAVGCEQGVHYYAMQFIEGQTLAQLIRELRAEKEEAVASGQWSVASGQMPNAQSSPKNIAGKRCQVTINQYGPATDH